MGTWHRSHDIVHKSTRFYSKRVSKDFYFFPVAIEIKQKKTNIWNL